MPPVTRPPAAVGGTPQPPVTNPGGLSKPPQVNTGPTGVAIRPNPSVSPPLITNPKPTANSVGRKPPVAGATNRALLRPQHPPAPPEALAAITALRPDLTPATLALYALSQRNASRPWWDPFGNYSGFNGRYGYGGFGYGGFGYGGFGYGGFGYGGFGGFGGYGYNPFGWAPFGFNPFGFAPFGGLGYGSGFSIGLGFGSGLWGYGGGYSGNFVYSPAIAYVPVYVETPVVVETPEPGPVNPPLLPQGGPDLPPPAAVQAEKPAPEADVDFAARGQELFLAGKYAEAVKALRHAVLDDPKNGPLLALTGEALWAAGNFGEAAGALQQSLLATPEEDWVGVAHRAARLTPADSVTALATALGKEEAPALRFLAGYQSFGAGKYDEAAAHLELAIQKAPGDQVAKKLREQALKLGEKK